MRTASERIKQAQSRYKADFDAHIRVRNQDLKPGDFVFVRRETGIEGESNKLQSPSMGPYKVVKKSSHTIIILDEDGLEDTVSLDRVVRTPNDSTGIDVPEEEDPPQEDEGQESEQPDSSQQQGASDPLNPTPQQDTSSTERPDDGRMMTRARARARRDEVQATPQPEAVARTHANRENSQTEKEILTEDESYDHGFDRILRYDAPANQFKVRWTGYTSRDDSWVNPEDLPSNAIVRFLRRRRLEIPDAVRDRLPHYLRAINTVDDVWL